MDVNEPCLLYLGAHRLDNGKWTTAIIRCVFGVWPPRVQNVILCHAAIVAADMWAAVKMFDPAIGFKVPAMGINVRFYSENRKVLNKEEGYTHSSACR